MLQRPLAHFCKMGQFLFLAVFSRSTKKINLFTDIDLDSHNIFNFCRMGQLLTFCPVFQVVLRSSATLRPSISVNHSVPKKGH
jgi:hypothetical protein